MRRSPRTRLFAASVAMVATLGLAACGDDDDDTTSSTDVDVTLSTSDTDVTVTDDTAVTDTDDSDVTVGDTIDTTGTGDTTDSSTPTSGGGEVGSQDDYIEAAQSEIGSEFDDQELSDCVGEAMVNDDVYAAIEEAGVTVAQFTEDGPAGLSVDESVADQVAADFAECGDLVPQITSEESELQCAEDNITNEQVAEFLAYSLLSLEPSAEVLAATEAVDDCVGALSTTTTG